MPRHNIEKGYMVLALGQYPRIYEEHERERARDFAIKERAKLLYFGTDEDFSK